MEKKRNKILVVITEVLVILLTSCVSSINKIDTQEHPRKYYNICVIVDGTDRMDNQGVIPLLCTDDLVNIARHIAKGGGGCLYVTYIDEYVANNTPSVFFWDKFEPKTLPQKPQYVTRQEFAEKKIKNKLQISEYQNVLDSTLNVFRLEVKTLLETAYSDGIALNPTGSDIFGAIHTAQNMLHSSSGVAPTNHIIIISDCQHNTRTTSPISLDEETELIVVNSTCSETVLDTIVSKKFVRLDQALRYLSL